MNAKSFSLLLLRVSLGLFLVVWGGDKLVNPEHAVAVSDGFYLGLVSAPALITAVGVAQVLLGLLLVAGVALGVAYPALLLITGLGLLAVWKSIVDPLGLFIEGGNPVFFASLVIFAGALVSWALRDEDSLALDAARRARRSELSSREPLSTPLA